MKRLVFACALACTPACVASGQHTVEVPLQLAGTAPAGPVAGRGGAEIELERARLAFGPLYLCAGNQAGELCETARLEWLDAVVVDALDAESTAAGQLGGVSGEVRSWMFDLGITSLLTEQEPLVLPAAQSLGDASLVLEGVAQVEDTAIPFAATIAIRQEEQTEVGIPVVRSSSSDAIDHEVEVDEPGLLIRFDAAPWTSDVDFAALLEDRACQPSGDPIVCAGTVEQSCDAAGDLVDARDCADLGMPCIVGLGCVERVDLDPEGQGGRSIRTQVVAGPRPVFSWGVEP